MFAAKFGGQGRGGSGVSPAVEAAVLHLPTTVRDAVNTAVAPLTSKVSELGSQVEDVIRMLRAQGLKDDPKEVALLGATCLKDKALAGDSGGSHPPCHSLHAHCRLIL